MKQMQYEIVNTAEKLLMDKKVDIFIGYENGTLPLRTSPCFVTKQGEARKLVWNSLCSNNLSVY
ncbi:MAG: 4Fe-4S ferredoxin, partial [candidate division WOR-3 bacterium]